MSSSVSLIKVTVLLIPCSFCVVYFGINTGILFVCVCACVRGGESVVFNMYGTVFFTNMINYSADITE